MSGGVVRQVPRRNGDEGRHRLVGPGVLFNGTGLSKLADTVALSLYQWGTASTAPPPGPTTPQRRR
jgi:hypothetical protein